MREKILIVTDNTHDQINGVVTTYKNIERHAITAGYDIVYIDSGQFPYIDCPGYPEVKLAWPRGIGKKITEINPTYVHIATEGPVGLAARLWLDWHKWKYNTSYHTKFPEFAKEISNIPLWLTYSYVKWFHRHSGKVLTTTDTMRNELISHGFKNNIVTWTRGVDKGNLQATSTHNNLSGNKPTVLYVGRVSKEKNLEKLCELQMKYNIRIVGDGPRREFLENTFQSVKFLGYKKGSDLANEYVNADVFAFPSLTDTFGIVIIEALALGCPVAAYPVPGPIDIIENGVTGFMDNKLSYAIENCLLLNRTLIQKASEKWTWDACWRIFKENLIQK